MVTEADVIAVRRLNQGGRTRRQIREALNLSAEVVLGIIDHGAHHEAAVCAEKASRITATMNGKEIAQVMK